MKNSFKVLFIYILIFLVSGCGWSDVQNEYGDLLKEGVTCTYTSSEKTAKDDFYKLEAIELSVDYDGFYVNFGNGRAVIVDTNGANNYISANNYQFNFSNDFIENYLKKYQENKACPEKLNITKDKQEIKIEDCEDKNCATYNLKTNTITTQNGIKKNCHHSLAVDCQKYSKESDDYGEKIYFEIGYYKIGGITKKYFGVSSDENFKNIIIDDDESDGFSVYQNTESYEIPIEAINEIWLSNNKYISSNELIIRAERITFTTYFITGSEVTNPGISASGDVDVETNIDPDNKQSAPIIEIETNLNYNNICLNSGVSSAFMIVGNVVKIIKWIAPLIIIILGMVDFSKALISSDDKAINKATYTLIRRTISGLVIFFVPTIIGFITKTILQFDILSNDNDFVSCTDCIFNPSECSDTIKLLQEQEKARKEQEKEEYEKEKEELGDNYSELGGNKYTKNQIIAMDEETVKNMTNEEFIEFIASAARIVYSEYGGVLPSITIAQAILESGYGNSFEPTSHNVFGLIGYPGEKPKVNKLRKFDNFYENTYYHYLYFENYSNVYGTFLRYCDNNDPLKAAALLYMYANGSTSYGPITIQLINQYDLTKYDK